MSLRDELLKAVGMVLKKMRGEFDTRAEDLNKRLAALEESGGGNFKYLGVFNKQRSYEQGNFVTFRGGLWHCNAKSVQGDKPGDGNGAWQLAVKSGRE